MSFIYVSRPPARPLAAFVDQLFYARGRVTYARERILPTGAPSLLINLGDAFLCHPLDRPERVEERRRGWLGGQQTTALVNAPLGETHVVGASFRPWGASALSGAPISELTDRSVPLDALFGTQVELLRERLADAATPELKLTILERTLSALCAPDEGWQSRLVHAVARLAGPHPFSVSALANELSVSHKQLITRFRRHVGLTPKGLERIFRLNRAIEMITTQSDPHWATIAHAAGYSDQPHFNRDFKHFSGLRPRDYVRQRAEVYGPDATETPQFVPDG